jgi:hypothetical protein
VNRWRRRGPLVVVALVVALAAGTSEAQPLVRLIGSVQWVTGTRMQVMSDTGASVTVDLMQTDQGLSQGLRSGDLVVVDGMLSADGRRIVARDLWRDSRKGYWTQSQSP